MMRRALLVLFSLTLAMVLCSCDRPTRDDCDEACGQVKVLAKADFDKKVADLPDEMKRAGWAEAGKVIDELVAVCSNACMDVGDRKLTQCLAGAKDRTAWQGCLDAAQQ